MLPVCLVELQYCSSTVFIIISPGPQVFRLRLNYSTSFPESVACRWQTMGFSLHNHVSQFLIINLSLSPPIQPSIDLPIHPSIHRSIDPNIHPSIHPSILLVLALRRTPTDAVIIHPLFFPSMEMVWPLPFVRTKKRATELLLQESCLTLSDLMGVRNQPSLHSSAEVLGFLYYLVLIT